MLKKIEDMNYYELLEVSHRATAQEIHKAYERIRKIYDPNSIALYSLFSPEETEKIRHRIEDAYRTLIYEENRREYDRTLQQFPDLGEPFPPAPVPPPRGLVERATIVPPPPPRRREAPAAAPQAVPPAAPKTPPPAFRPAETRPEAAAPPVPTIPSTLQPAPASIAEFTGPMLKMLREQRGLSVRQIADTTKLSARYIEGIEEEGFTKLPARPYLRGFLFSYARAIGYEPQRIVNDYMKRYDAAMVQQKKGEKP